MLVNAVMAFACHYSDRPGARVDPCNSHTAGDEFFEEAKRLLDLDDRPSLTTVQALAIMSLRQASHGLDSSAYRLTGRCVRMTVELGLHLSVTMSELTTAEAEVRKITFWGVFNLEMYVCTLPCLLANLKAQLTRVLRQFSMGVGRLAMIPRTAADVAKPIITERTESHAWIPYEDTNLAHSPYAEQPGKCLQFVEQQSKLSEIASDMLSTFYAPKEQVTSRRLAALYAGYQAWFKNLPDCFRLENTSLPQVLLLHMRYYSCVLQ